jgi:hypothetical protein
VEFKDKGNGEELTIHKYGKAYIIKACGNKVDGGFFGYAWGKEAEWREDNGKYAPGYKEIVEENDGAL